MQKMAMINVNIRKKNPYEPQQCVKSKNKSIAITLFKTLHLKFKIFFFLLIVPIILSQSEQVKIN